VGEQYPKGSGVSARLPGSNGVSARLPGSMGVSARLPWVPYSVEASSSPKQILRKPCSDVEGEDPTPGLEDTGLEEAEPPAEEIGLPLDPEGAVLGRILAQRALTPCLVR